MQSKFVALVFVLLVLGPSNCELRTRFVNKLSPQQYSTHHNHHHKIQNIQQDELKDLEGPVAPPDNRAMLGAFLGFPIGYVTAQSTLASSGDDDPAAGAFAHGLAGAAAGYLIASKWAEADNAAKAAKLEAKLKAIAAMTEPAEEDKKAKFQEVKKAIAGEEEAKKKAKEAADLFEKEKADTTSTPDKKAEKKKGNG